MDFLRKLFQNPNKAIYGIVAFLVLLLMFWSIGTRANDSTLEFSGGSTIVRGYSPVIGVDIGFPRAGPVNTDYEIGMKLIGSSEFRDEHQDNQIALHAALIDGYKNVGIGFGMAYLSNTDAYNGGHANFWLMLRYRFHERVRLQYEHMSCAGSCDPNLGRDLATLAWRF